MTRALQITRRADEPPDIRCVDHLEFVGNICPDCHLDVDWHGNTEDQLDHCCYPDCGCPEFRLCMASVAGSTIRVRSGDRPKPRAIQV